MFFAENLRLDLGHEQAPEISRWLFVKPSIFLDVVASRFNDANRQLRSRRTTMLQCTDHFR